MKRHLLTAIPLFAFAAAGTAQHTVLMTAGTSDERTLGLDAPELDLIRNDEIYAVTPLPGTAYTAWPFLPTSLEWYYVGDGDGDAQYVEASTDGPGGAIDAIFVKSGAVGPVSPRDVFFSIASTNTHLPGVSTADVVRYSAQGVREVFVSEAQLMTATGGTSLNLDALCQTPAGDLLLSFSLTETLAIGSVDDGDLLLIPAAAITYDADGNVAAIAADSVALVATQADLIAMVNNSGFHTSVGGTVTTSFDLTGLEVDPNGGTFVAPQDPTIVLPDLLFCWNDFSNDGALISTAGGGSIGVVNGVAMGSTVATQGDQIGWLPDSTGTNGPGGLALIPLQPASYAVLNYPRNLHTQGTGQTLLQIQLSGGTPGGASVIALSVESAIANGAFPVIAAPAPFVGEFGMTAPAILGVYFHDAMGNTQSDLLILATPPLSGANISVQALDVSTFQLSTPGALSFL
ncbi:MAG: hypothetical protein H6835_18355 [Planctomycetes bacterium]|nr:hypothetical protein [Planctomycetota bacterium]